MDYVPDSESVSDSPAFPTATEIAERETKLYVPDDATAILIALVNEVGSLRLEVRAMQTTMDAILLKFDGIANEVGPVVESISAHPLFKMLGGGKKP